MFLVNLPIGLAAMIAAVPLIARSPAERGEGLPDLRGAALLATSIAALTLGLVEGSHWGWTDPRISLAWVVAAVGLAGFVLSSTRHPSPIIDPALLRVRAFSVANVTAVLFSIPFATSLLANILWMQQVWGFTPLRTGFAVAPGPLMVAPVAALAHRLSARIPVGYLVAVGCLLFGAGSPLIAGSVGADPHYATDMLPGLLVGGAGVGFALPAILSSATADLPPSRSATGSAVVNMSRQTGTALGVALFVAVVGTPVAYEAAHDAFQHAWWALAAVSALAALTAPLMTPRRLPPTDAPVPAPPCRDSSVAALEAG